MFKAIVVYEVANLSQPHVFFTEVGNLARWLDTLSKVYTRLYRVSNFVFFELILYIIECS